jgi:hypothetical protein
MLERFKSLFFTIAVLVGCGLAWLLSPLEWFDGLVLFLLGSAAGDWNRQLNPNEYQAEGPILPWDDMHSGDKLAYFLPAVATVIGGLIFLMMAIQFFRISNDWIGIGTAIFIIGLGVATAYWKWSHRYS